MLLQSDWRSFSMEENILLVENDKELAFIVMEHMQRASYKVIWTSVSIEAVKKFQNQDFSLILLDLTFHEVDGYVIYKNIRLISNVPIIIISSRESDFSKIEKLKIVSDDYVTMPFSIMDLKAKVETNIRRYKKFNSLSVSEDENLLKYNGGLYIDKNSKEVLINKKVIDLTEDEYSILVLLAENPNVTFNKNEIYQNICGKRIKSDIDANTIVTIHMKNLRLKLNEDIKKPLFLQTSWGIGYKFIGEKQ
jgi:two-component system OmpR family response regulator